MPGLSVVDDDNGMELTGLRQASLTFKHTDFQGWRDNPDWTIEKYVRGILASECNPWTEIVKLASPTTCGPYWRRHKFRSGALDKPTSAPDPMLQQPRQCRTLT
jgi:hypothetical protein